MRSNGGVFDFDQQFNRPAKAGGLRRQVAHQEDSPTEREQDEMMQRRKKQDVIEETSSR